MKLNRIEIRGFKSIAKKTDLPVSDGITCIAGPNGCGKSNIVDAIRWALGEQSTKSLRAGAMGDVIFSGTQEIGPGSHAQVTLEFIRDGGFFPQSLDGFDQVSISRKLFKTGESVYAINNVKCRLKDITDLFLDTGLDRYGYAIVEQGKVKDIIQSRPEDIRYLIEEVAEVGKFRVKREDAIRRLEATSKNLERVSDLLEEVSRQRNDLKAQANRARRYQMVRDQINDLTKHLWGYELDRISSKRTALTQEEDRLKELLERKKEDISTFVAAREDLEKRLKAHREDMESISSDIRDANTSANIAQAEIENLHHRKGDLATTLGMLTSRVDNMKKAILAEQARMMKERGELVSLEADLERCQKEAEARQASADEIHQEYTHLERDYDMKRAELFDIIGQARALEQRISGIESRNKEVCSSITKRKSDIAEQEERAGSLTETLARLETEVQSKQGELSLHMNELRGIETHRDELKVCIEKERADLHTHEKDRAENTAKVTILDQVIQDAIKSQEGSSESRNGNTRVSEALRVRQGFEETVGRSVGEALEFLIIKDHDEFFAQPDIESAGPGFVPEQPYIDHSRSSLSIDGDGILGPLSAFIESDKQYEGVILALSRDMWVVKDIQSAVSLWRAGQRSCPLVTRDGLILETTGVIRTTRNTAKYGQGLKARKDKELLLIRSKEIEAQIEQCTGRIRHHHEEQRQLEERFAMCSGSCNGIQRDIQTLEYQKRDASRDLERIRKEVGAFTHDLEMLSEMADKLSRETSLLIQEKASLDETISAHQGIVKELNEHKDGLWKRYEDVKAALQQQILKTHELKIGWASRNERIQAIQKNIDQKQHEIEIDTVRIGELTNTVKTFDSDLASAQQTRSEAREKAERLQSAYSEVAPEYEKVSHLLTQLKDDLSRGQESVEKQEKELNELLFKLKEYEISYRMGKERMQARFGNSMPRIPESFDPEQTNQRLELLEQKLEKMGQINFTSITAYEQVQTRWDDLHRQYQDIVQASTRLREVISNIERQSRKAFMATFTKVRQHFQEIFTTMFGGGKADIILEEGESLDAAVEIYASPPFKRLKAMSLLSEGEKTLCALSFIFALFSVKPSPFCILDEVDAPLDDANVIRFNRLIRSFSQKSQFIIVTHNRYTMEMADILYGVTFDVPGISKIVSMELRDQQG
ncbi:MAG: chromosome segregation protein SMC [Desulfomonilia bacterium]